MDYVRKLFTSYPVETDNNRITNIPIVPTPPVLHYHGKPVRYHPTIPLSEQKKQEEDIYQNDLNSVNNLFRNLFLIEDKYYEMKSLMFDSAEITNNWDTVEDVFFSHKDKDNVIDIIHELNNYISIDEIIKIVKENISHDLWDGYYMILSVIDEIIENIKLNKSKQTLALSKATNQLPNEYINTPYSLHDLPPELLENIGEKLSNKKIKGGSKSKRKKSTKKKSKKRNLSNKKYLQLIKQKQKRKISKKNSKRLEKELQNKYCECVKKLKYSKNKSYEKGSEYPICTSSIYKNRNFNPPKSLRNNCINPFRI